MSDIDNGDGLLEDWKSKYEENRKLKETCKSGMDQLMERVDKTAEEVKKGAGLFQSACQTKGGVSGIGAVKILALPRLA